MKVVHVFTITRAAFGNNPAESQTFRLTIDVAELGRRMGDKAFYRREGKAVMGHGIITCRRLKRRARVGSALIP
jgi:hypothetical protein